MLSAGFCLYSTYICVMITMYMQTKESCCMDTHPCRKCIRLQEYDYSTPGAYFVTICTINRQPILSKIFVGQGLAPAVVRLSDYGRMAQQQLMNIPRRFPNIQIDNYVIMPNHIHILFSVKECTCLCDRASVIDAVRVFKSITTRMCRCGKVFQTSFYDHIVRNQEDYDAVWTYIDNNPTKWKLDRFYLR